MAQHEWSTGVPAWCSLGEDGVVTVSVDLAEIAADATETSGNAEQDAESPPATQAEYEAINKALDEGRVVIEPYVTPTDPSIIVAGNVGDGLTFYGPFATSEEAIEFGDSVSEIGDWVVCPLAPPAEARI